MTTSYSTSYSKLSTTIITGDQGVVDDNALAAKIPFEIKSSDEKFLQEVSGYTSIQLSELDVCHHKIVLGLHSSCSDLTEDELAKVSVNLLNCQSAAEGRKIYPCTEDMSLAQCTHDMDPNTWNAYHIVSNRARAVCYAVRQTQFQAKTEMAVNKLMVSAEEQIHTMTDLQENQKVLEKATTDTIESLNSGHERLKQQQHQLSSAQHSMHSYVSSNLRELAREKRLIASGQQELALMTEAIKRKLDEARKQMSSQEDSQRETHTTILQDLASIQDNAQAVWKKLDESTQKILASHEDTVRQYEKMASDLDRMNNTVHHLMDVLHSTKKGVEAKLSWISTMLGDTDETLHKFCSCVLHAAYFLVGMVAASFLQLPYLTRLALVVLVPLNAMSEVKHDTSLDFSTLTTVLSLCVLANLTFSLLRSIYTKKPEYEYHNLSHLSLPSQPWPGAMATIKPHDLNTTTLSNAGKDDSRTSLSSDRPSLAAVNNSVMDLVKGTDPVGDYSSDEENFTAGLQPPQQSTLRKRDVSTVAEKEPDTYVANEDRTSMGPSRHTDKLVWSVRRHLMQELERPVTPMGPLHDMSLDSAMQDIKSPTRSSRASSRSRTPSRSMTPKVLCTSMCKNGQLCKNAATGNSQFCYRHNQPSRSSTPTLG